MNNTTNGNTSMVDVGLNNFMASIYNAWHFNAFDLVVNHGLLQMLFLLSALSVIPSIRLYQYSYKQVLPLHWKLGCRALFFGVSFLFLLTCLATVLRISNMTFLDNLKGIPVTIWQVMYQFLFWDLVGLSFALIGGFFITYFYIQGRLEPYLEALSLGLIRKNSSRDKSLSDIRVSMDEVKTLDYDVERYINPQKGVFVGLDDQQKPVYIPLKMLRESHVAILGATGNGKGVASQMILTQIHQLGSSLVLIDPKKEEFLYSVFKQSARGEFKLIDLDIRLPQFNPIAHLNGDRLYPILESALSLKDKGQEADFHRGNERINLRKAIALYEQGMTFDDWFKVIMSQAPKLIKTKDGELSKLGQGFLDISMCRALHGTANSSDFDLQSLLNQQGTIYIKCQEAKSSSSVKLATKIVLMVILEAIEKRKVSEEQHHVAIMLDELKFILTERVSQALGSIRNKGASLILNYQSDGDLANPDDVTLDGQAVQQQINANTAIKICYSTLDNKNNSNMSILTGSIVKEARSTVMTTNEKLVAITGTDEAHAHQQRESLYTENDFLSLPKRVAILIGIGLAKRIYTAPVKVVKQDFPEFTQSDNQGYLESLLFGLDADPVGDAAEANQPQPPAEVLTQQKTPIVENEQSKKAETALTKKPQKNHPLGDF